MSVKPNETGRAGERSFDSLDNSVGKGPGALAGRAGLVGVVFVSLLGGLGGRVVVLAALREGLVAAVHAGGLHRRRRRAAAQQVRQPAQGRQRAEGPERARLGQELREGDGGGQGTRGRPSSGRAPGGATLQVRLL